MGVSDSTCWTVIRGAAGGCARDRDHFVRAYAPVVRGYLSARWAGTPRIEEVDDAVQEVLLDCFRQGGALDRCERGRPGGFRAFLYGVTRVVALRFERSGARRDGALREEFDGDRVEDDAPSPSRLFDRAWAAGILREAYRTFAGRAEAGGEAAQRRKDLLRARFEEGLPIREIARRWDVDCAWLHKEYARARRDFRSALYEVVAFHHPGSPAEIERQCVELIDLLD